MMIIRTWLISIRTWDDYGTAAAICSALNRLTTFHRSCDSLHKSRSLNSSLGFRGDEGEQTIFLSLCVVTSHDACIIILCNRDWCENFNMISHVAVSSNLTMSWRTWRGCAWWTTWRKIKNPWGESLCVRLWSQTVNRQDMMPPQ